MEHVSWFLTGPFLYAALLVSIAGAGWKIVRFARLPRHLRWELYPIPRLGPAGSKYQHVDFAKRPRCQGSRLAEIRFMAAEILLLRSVYHRRRSLWPGSLLLHAGLYLGAAFVVLLAVEALTPADLAASLTPRMLHAVVTVTGAVATIAGFLGACLLLERRLVDPGLRAMSDVPSYANLLLLAALFGSGAAAWWFADPGFAQSREHLGALLCGRPGTVASALLVLPMVLLGTFLAYLPFSRMFHIAAKYFFYHEILWEDESLRRGSAMEKTFAGYLDYRSTWSAGRAETPPGAQEAAKQPGGSSS